MGIQIETCWALLKHHYGSQEGKEKKKAEKIRHAGSVLNLCREITASLEPRIQECIDSSLLEAAAVLHDISKYDPGEHQETAVDVIIEECQYQRVNPIDSAYFFALGEIIRAHKGEFNPHPRVALEAAILRMADKLDKGFSEPEQEARKSFDKSLGRIEKYSQNVYEKIEKACYDTRFRELYP